MIDHLILLRMEAEKMLADHQKIAGQPLSPLEIQELLHNVQVQQIELEMQNDELKISNDQLEMQRARFANLFDIAPVGYFILNRYAMVEEANANGLLLISVDKSRVINKRFQNFVTENEGPVFSSFLFTLRNTGVKHSCTITMQKYGGATFYAQVEGIASPQGSSDYVRYYLAVIDITERTNDAIKMRQTNERLNIALSSSAAGTWEINLKNGRIFLDNFSRTIFGFENNRFDGRPDTFLFSIHPDDRTRVEQQLMAALKNEKELDVEFRVLRPNHSLRHVAARGHVIYNDNKLKSFVGILIDIHHKKQLENEAEQLKLSQLNNITAAALQAQENERKRISGALHDSVSQLLYGIKLNLDNQNADAGALKKIGQLLDMAIQETRNISFELAPSILTDFGLTATIQEMCKRLSTSSLMIKSFISGLKNRLAPDVEISTFRIAQELVNNSIKHAGATVIHINVVKKSNALTIEVTDNGKGFDYNEQSKTFNGTGLASIKNRLSLFNGTLKIDTRPGGGTKVLITLNEQGKRNLML